MTQFQKRSFVFPVDFTSKSADGNFCTVSLALSYPGQLKLYFLAADKRRASSNYLVSLEFVAGREDFLVETKAFCHAADGYKDHWEDAPTDVLARLMNETHRKYGESPTPAQILETASELSTVVPAQALKGQPGYSAIFTPSSDVLEGEYSPFRWEDPHESAIQHLHLAIEKVDHRMSQRIVSTQTFGCGSIFLDPCLLDFSKFSGITCHQHWRDHHITDYRKNYPGWAIVREDEREGDMYEVLQGGIAFEVEQEEDQLRGAKSEAERLEISAKSLLRRCHMYKSFEEEIYRNRALRVWKHFIAFRASLHIENMLTDMLLAFEEKCKRLQEEKSQKTIEQEKSNEKNGTSKKKPRTE